MKIAILTNFNEFNPGYSLTGIVQDQCRMLHKYRHDVSIVVLDKFNDKKGLFPHGGPPVKVLKKMPFGNLIDYKTQDDLTDGHKELAQRISKMLRSEFFDYDIIFTHDLIFTGWNLPHAVGIKLASPHMPNVRWMHWIHSIPSTQNDWWSIRAYGKNHRIIFPNSSNRILVAEQYRGTIDSVRTIPHIKDIRTFFDFHKDTCEFIDKYPSAMRADIVNIYPAGTDRLSAKGVDTVISIMGNLKKMGFTVCFVCANQWSHQRQEDIAIYKSLAEAEGLVPGKDFIFTSEWNDKYANGLPKEILRELMMLANLFVFPTNEESFGLVAPEIALASGALCVFNKSLDQMMEIHGYAGMFCDFGSNTRPDFNPPIPWNTYLNEITKLIASRMGELETLRHRSFIRQRYNMDNLYEKYYAPIMEEARKGWLP